MDALGVRRLGYTVRGGLRRVRPEEHGPGPREFLRVPCGKKLIAAVAQVVAQVVAACR